MIAAATTLELRLRSAHKEALPSAMRETLCWRRLTPQHNSINCHPVTKKANQSRRDVKKPAASGSERQQRYRLSKKMTSIDISGATSAKLATLKAETGKSIDAVIHAALVCYGSQLSAERIKGTEIASSTVLSNKNSLVQVAAHKVDSSPGDEPARRQKRKTKKSAATAPKQRTLFDEVLPEPEDSKA